MPSFQNHARSKATPVSDNVEERVEHICEQGCRVVRKAIDDFEHGEPNTDLQNLSDHERTRVMAELKDVMSVYEKDGPEGCGS